MGDVRGRLEFNCKNFGQDSKPAVDLVRPFSVVLGYGHAEKPPGFGAGAKLKLLALGHTSFRRF